MARVNGCCCFDLKTGSLIIAILGWFGTLAKVFGGVSAVDGYNDMGSSTLAYRIAYSVIAFICCVFLVIGIMKKQAGWFLPYLIIVCAECVLSTILSVVLFAFIFIAPPDLTTAFVLTFFIFIIFTALAWYFWMVVYSYYHEVKAEGQVLPTVHMYPGHTYPNQPLPNEFGGNPNYNQQYPNPNMPYYSTPAGGNMYPNQNQAFTNQQS